MISFVRYQLPAVVWMVVIFVASSIPGSDLPEIKIWNSDKLIHIGIFFVLCWLFNRALWFQSRSPFLKYRSVGFAFLFVAIYAVLDEFHQGFVPGRTQDVFDVIADIIGGAMFTLIFLLGLVMKKNGNREQS